jgi:hypothetical protein
MQHLNLTVTSQFFLACLIFSVYYFAQRYIADKSACMFVSYSLALRIRISFDNDLLRREDEKLAVS